MFRATWYHQHTEISSTLTLLFRVSRPGPGPNVEFLPELASVKAAVADLKKQNIDKIIAIGHSGIAVDRMIAREVADIDVIVGGHSNTFLYKGATY